MLFEYTLFDGFYPGAADHGSSVPRQFWFGRPRETQEMLDFCGEYGIAADIEIIAASAIDEIRYRRDPLSSGDRYSGDDGLTGRRYELDAKDQASARLLSAVAREWKGRHVWPSNSTSNRADRRGLSCPFHPNETNLGAPHEEACRMTGSAPQTHTRTVDGTTYTVETSQHERGISIVVDVPGTGPEEENDRTYASVDEALVAGDEIARTLIRQLDPSR